MKIKSLFFTICLFIIACQSDKQKQQTEIQALENAANESTDAFTLDTLLATYQTYFTTYPDDKAQTTTYKKNAKSLLNKRLLA